MANIPTEWLGEAYVRLFIGFGKIDEMKVNIDSYTGYIDSRCFVRYRQKEVAENAMKVLNE